jgi:hypothetical protein
VVTHLLLVWVWVWVWVRVWVGLRVWVWGCGYGLWGQRGKAVGRGGGPAGRLPTRGCVCLTKGVWCCYVVQHGDPSPERGDRDGASAALAETR